jgi:hypothetical protein
MFGCQKLEGQSICSVLRACYTAAADFSAGWPIHEMHMDSNIDLGQDGINSLWHSRGAETVKNVDNAFAETPYGSLPRLPIINQEMPNFMGQWETHFVWGISSVQHDQAPTAECHKAAVKLAVRSLESEINPTCRQTGCNVLHAQAGHLYDR